jgi:hypothetical protein
MVEENLSSEESKKKTLERIDDNHVPKKRYIYKRVGRRNVGSPRSRWKYQDQSKWVRKMGRGSCLDVDDGVINYKLKPEVLYVFLYLFQLVTATCTHTDHVFRILCSSNETFIDGNLFHA